MGSRSRVFAALTLAVAPATVGLTAVPSFAAEAVQAKGGCWAYSVAGTSGEQTPQQIVEASEAAASDLALTKLKDGLIADRQADPPVAPIVSQLDWSPKASGAQLALASSGDTARSGTRDFELTLTDGPALQTSSAPAAGGQIKGQAHAVLLAYAPDFAEGDTPERIFASTDFTGDEGQPLDKLTFTTAEGLKLAQDGLYRVVLQSVYFVAPGADAASAPQMWVCNAQTEAKDSADTTTGAGGVVVPGANPVTAPLGQTDVVSAFSVQQISTITVASVEGQRFTNAARAGDVVVLTGTGLPSSADVRVAFGPSGQLVAADLAATTTESGGLSDQMRVVVPEDVPAGEGVLTFVDNEGKAVGAQMAFEVLEAPSLALAESVEDDRIEVAVSGTGFDPYSEVRLRSRSGDASTSDVSVTVDVDARGRFEVAYTVEDAEADAVRARQSRTGGKADLVVREALEAEVPGGGTTKSPSPTPTVSTTPTSPATPVTPVAPVAAPVAPPVAIPVPPTAPLQEIPAPPLDVAETSELKVSEARLEGSPNMAELFGGSSRRSVAFEVENVGTGTVEAPPVLLGVGRSTDVEPGLVATQLDDLEPGARVAVDVKVALPIASLGTYQVVGQVGEDATTTFSVRWDTFPWGLIALNLAGAGLLAWGVTRRRRAAAPLPTGPTVEEAGASVVDLSALDKWWKEGKVVHTPVTTEDDNDSVVDLDAADRWWSRNRNKVS